MPEPDGNALLGVLLWLGGAASSSSSSNNSSGTAAAAAAARNTTTLVALIQAILAPSSNNKQSSQQQQQLSVLDQAAVRLVKMQQQQKKSSKNTLLLRLLQVVLELQQQQDTSPQQRVPATLVVPLIQHVWNEFPHLLHATSLVAEHGPTALDRFFFFADKEEDDNNNNDKMQVEGSSEAAAMEVEDSSDDEEDERVTPHNTTDMASQLVALKTNNSAVRVTKQDILTAPKLECLFAETRTAWSRQQAAQLSNSSNNNNNNMDKSLQQALITSLAKHLSSPQLWLEWSQVLLTSLDEHEASQVRARRALITCLSLLLQQACRTGLHRHTSATSPFLRHLAFGGSSGGSSSSSSSSLVTHLWRYLLVQELNAVDKTDIVHAFSTWSIFCDVYSHQLIAMRDQVFLQQHAVPQDFNNNSGVVLAAVQPPQPRQPEVMAEHVISHLRQRLYDLYWAQPVLAAECHCLLQQQQQSQLSTEVRQQQLESAARVRLFLTGTKLWNSLYQRWCRLVRQTPFCDESTWLFPNHGGIMTNLLATNGGVATGAPGDAMDVDDEDDDDSDQEDESALGGAAAQHSGTTAHDAETEALAGAFQDPKMARLLTSIPQCLPFDRRVKLFSTLLQVDKARTQDESDEMRAQLVAMMRGEELETTTRVQVEIRRQHLYHDAMQQLNRWGPKLRKKVKVSFINQHGAPEAGIDGGGVFKEFLDDLIKLAFSPAADGSGGGSGGSAGHAASSAASDSLQLFAVTPLETLHVNPTYAQDPQYLSHYEFLGRAVGKAVYESILVEPQFCLPFLNTMLGKSNTLEDLKNFDPAYYASLTKLMDMTDEDIRSTGLMFEVNLPSSTGGQQQQPVELVPGGATQPVTKHNVIQYAHLVSHRLLNVQGAPQIKAFLHGFRDLIPAPWVRLFAAHELQKLVSGDDAAGASVDVASWRECVDYAAGYHPSQPMIAWFWDIVQNDLTPAQQGQLLKFWTSCSRPPLLGFSSLEPRLCIQQVRLSPEQAQHVKDMPLPTAATCLNLLKLPNYANAIVDHHTTGGSGNANSEAVAAAGKHVLRQKLLQAISAGAGFELS